MKRETRPFWGYFIVSYLALLVSFSPVVWLEAVYHDNTRYFSYDGKSAKKSCCKDPQYGWLYLIGRPISAEIECQIFKYTEQFSDLQKLRILVIGVMALSSAMFSMMLKKSGLDWLASFLLSVAIFTLPGMQNAAFMTNLTNCISVLCAFLAILVQDPLCSDPLNQWKIKGIFKNVVSIILLIVSGLAYPTMSFVFVWILLVNIVNGQDKSCLFYGKFVIRYLMFFLIAMSLSILVGKMVIHGDMAQRMSHIPEQFRPDFSIISFLSKIPFLFSDIIPYAASFWLMKGGIFSRIMLVTIGLALFILAAFSKKNMWSIQVTAAKIVCIFLFIIFAFAPTMLAKVPVLHQRVLFPGMGVLLILAVLLIPVAICSINQTVSKLSISRVCAFSALCFGLIAANYSLLKNAWNTNIEMMFVRSELAKFEVLPRRIHIVRAVNNNTGFNKLSAIGDEFNRKTTEYSQDILYFLETALLERHDGDVSLTFCDPSVVNCEVAVPKSDIIVSFSDYGQEVCRSRDMALVDLNVLVRATSTGTPDLVNLDSIPFCSAERFHVSTSAKPTERGHDIGKAFDNSTAPNDFWETTISSPVTVDIHYQVPTIFVSYSLSAGESAGRMPLSWELYGSQDSREWELIDSVNWANKWKPNEKRTYSILRSNAYSFIRFVFRKSSHPQILRIYELTLNENNIQN